jgi:hypothetical protein
MILALSTLLLVALAAGSHAQATKPHIVFILADE